MRLKAFAHLGYDPLRGDAEHLRECKGRHRLQHRRGTRDERQRDQQIRALLSDYLVDEHFRARRKHEAKHPVDEHDAEADSQSGAMRPDQFTCLAPDDRHLQFSRLGGFGAARLGGLSDLPAHRWTIDGS